jgi:hypothetical protein
VGVQSAAVPAPQGISPTKGEGALLASCSPTATRLITDNVVETIPEVGPMGMYDYIRCEVPLPDGFTGELQTKDFDCQLVTHIITKEGRLMKEQIDGYEEVPKAERPYPDASGNDFHRFIGSVRTITSRHDAKFHGIVNFYGCDGNHEDGTYQWHEYNAKFTDGQLVSIERDMRRIR